MKQIFEMETLVTVFAFKNAADVCSLSFFSDGRLRREEVQMTGNKTSSLMREDGKGQIKWKEGIKHEINE